MTDSIHAAFAAAYQQVQNPKKNATNPAFKSGYANLEEVLDCIKPILESQNLVLVQESVNDENRVGVHTVIRDEAGESIDFGCLHLPLAKSDPQGAGSALTYARRYALKSIFGLAEVDDDGAAACADPKPKPNPLKADWDKIKKAYKGHTDRRAAVLKYLGDPKSEDAALAAFCALGEAERVAVWTLANGGEVE